MQGRRTTNHLIIYICSISHHCLTQYCHLSLPRVLTHVGHLATTYVDTLSLQPSAATHEIFIQLGNISDWSNLLHGAHHPPATATTGLEIF